MALRILFTTTTLLLTLWSGVDAQFNAFSCASLAPASGNIQQGQAPFIVATVDQAYTAGGNAVAVFLASTTSLTAQSVLLQARRVGSTDNTPVGSFDVPSVVDYQTLQCSSSSAGTIISRNTNPKTFNLQFMWNPPATGVGNVEFRASIVETNGNAWVGVASLSPLTGPNPPVGLPLAIDTCPNVAPGSTTYPAPLCRRGGAVVGTATCSPPSGFAFPDGGTTVTCTCVDSGEIASCPFIVTVTPTATPCNPNPCQNGAGCIPVPQLPSGLFCSCINGFSGDRCTEGGVGPGPLTTTPCPPNLNNFGNTFIWTPPSCTRDGNVVGSSTCFPSSGNTFTGAVNQVVCTCSAGDEQATCPFNINAGPAGPACAGNPCVAGFECREAASALAGYTCHSSTGTPCN